MEIKLKAEKRSETGKGPARRMRVAGEVPAVLYGTGVDPSPIKVKKEELSELLHGKGGVHTLIDLVVVDGKEKENHLVMIKEIQRHPLKEMLLHVDFMQVARDEKVTTKVAVAVNGEEESPGLKAGGTVQHNLWEVEVECLPAEMPDHLYIDISHLQIGEHMTVADLTAPPGVTILTEPGDMVLTILPPRLAEEVVEAVPAEELAAGLAEGEPEEAAQPGGEES